jgi:glycopeptide antibiotics resistance protein
MFLPVLALCLIFVRVKPWIWVLLAALASAGIEVTQGFVLPHRKLDLTDFLANTAGAMLGGFVGVIILRFMGSRVPSDPEDRSAVD